MRRAWARALTLTILFNVSLLFPSEVLAARYVDMPGNWAEKFVNQLSDEGVIPAEKDGKFRPETPVTRAVLSFWLVNALGLKDKSVPQTPSFSDVKTTDWFFKPVEIVKQSNYIAGYADGFRPNQFIQRGEVITIIARTLGTSDPDETTVAAELSKYKDGANVPDWARVGVAKASLAGLSIAYLGEKMGDSQSTLKATTLATRADTAALICALDSYKTKASIDAATAKASLAAGVQTSQPAAPVYSPYKPYSGRPILGQPALAQDYGGQYQIPGSSPPYRGQGQYAQPGQGAYPQPGQGYPPQGQFGGYPPNGYLQGRVAIVAAGTQFRAAIINTLDSGSSQPGEQVTATLSEPLYASGQEVIPAGSRIVGQVTNVVSAKHFKFGANGRIDVRFTSIETPDGRRFPLSASIDANQMHLTGGTTGGRVGKGLLTTGVGAAGGAALGTGLGAITGGLSHSRSVGMSTGMGAAFGSAMGGVVGLGAATYRKGGEVKIPAGAALPVRLDESLQVSGPPTQMQQPYGGGYGGGYPPPVQQPAGGYYPQPQ